MSNLVDSDTVGAENCGGQNISNHPKCKRTLFTEKPNELSASEWIKQENDTIANQFFNRYEIVEDLPQ
jgi:hypothetical protein